MRGGDEVAMDGTMGPRREVWICWLRECVIIVYSI